MRKMALTGVLTSLVLGLLVMTMPIGAQTATQPAASQTATLPAATGTPLAGGTATPSPAGTETVASPTVAQTATPQRDPCGPPLRSGYTGGIGVPTQSPYDYSGLSNGSGYSSSYPPGGGGYGYPHDEANYYTPQPTPTATPIPQPVNPQTKVCEHGDVRITVSTDRHGTYRIGDHIRIIIDIDSAPNVQIDFSSIQQRQLLLDVLNAEFEIAADPVIVTSTGADGRIHHHLEVTVQTWRLYPVLWFKLELRYAARFESDGITPDWQRLVTPDFQITTTTTHDHGQDPLIGDMATREQSHPVVATPLLGFGILLILTVPLTILVIWFNRTRPGRVIPPEEIAWTRLNAAFLMGDKHGYGRSVCEAIAAAVLTYADNGAMRSATYKEALDYLANENNPLAPAIKRILDRSERIIVAPANIELKLEKHEIEQLHRDVEAVVPRPSW